MNISLVPAARCVFVLLRFVRSLASPLPRFFAPVAPRVFLPSRAIFLPSPSAAHCAKYSSSMSRPRSGTKARNLSRSGASYTRYAFLPRLAWHIGIVAAIPRLGQPVRAPWKYTPPPPLDGYLLRDRGLSAFLRRCLQRWNSTRCTPQGKGAAFVKFNRQPRNSTPADIHFRIA